MPAAPEPYAFDRMQHHIETAFGITLPSEALEDCMTLKDILRLIEAELEEETQT